MFALWIGMIALLFQIQGKDAGTHNVWTDGNEVWMQTNSGPRQLTRDGIPKRLPVLAPDGKRVVYVVDYWPPDVRLKEGDGEEEDVVETDDNGNVLRDTTSTDVAGAKVDWTDDSHLQLTTRGRTFTFVVDGNQLREITLK
jgi:hypothetical protein